MRYLGRPRRVLAALLIVGGMIGVAASWRTAAVAWRLRDGLKARGRGDDVAALDRFLAAERLDPSHARTQFLLARAYRRLGKVEEMSTRLEKARVLGFPIRQIEREFVLAEAQAGLLAQAEPVLDELLTSPGDDGPEICAAYISGYLQNYEFEKARQLLDAWIGDFPNDPEPWIAYGKISLHWSNFPDAEKQFRRALTLRPDYHGAVAKLGEALVEQKKYQEALPLLENSNSRDDSAETRLLVAQCLLNLGRESEALEIYADVVSRVPDNCAALLGLGQAKIWAGQYEGALDHLNRALELCPRNLDARYARAQAWSLQGQRSQAQPELQEVSTARAALTRAGELASEILRNPRDLEARIEIGTILIRYGDRDEGASWISSALQYEPNHQAAHRLLAEYYEQQGDKERAERHRHALKRR